MKYENVCKGKFISRPNRFIAIVEVEGTEVRAHVKNTGRCKELLVEGAIVYLEDFDGRMGSRKLRYSLIGVEKEHRMINMDSQAPNKVVEEALAENKIELLGMDKLSYIKREKTFGNSRFDFYIEDINGNKGWIEVKGVTLEENGVVRFPDAPTERGVKHLQELIKAKELGYNAYVIFVIQMKDVRYFEPNDYTHKAFGDTLRMAKNKGVEVLAYDCNVGEDSLEIRKKVDFGKKL